MKLKEKRTKIEKIIKNATPKEKILFMVEGLRKRHTKIKMSTYGYKSQDGVCFGCAATNAVIEIAESAGIKKLKYNLKRCREQTNGFSSTLGGYSKIIEGFEISINNLRCNIVPGFLRELPISIIKGSFRKLPILGDDYTEADLQKYEDFANALD